jgi:hypothetical protein
MTDLTPESEALLERFHAAEENHDWDGPPPCTGFDLECGEVKDALAAIEAAAIARDREGPVTEHADPRYRPLMLAVRAADEAYEKAGDAGTKTWLDDYFLPELTTHGLTVRLLALDAPEAQA